MYSRLFLSCVWASGTLAAYSLGAPEQDAWYDYVIVGGGTGGLALAARLASDPQLSIAVVEAGGFSEADVGNLSFVPAYDAFFAGTNPNDTNPLIDWGLITEPQAGANNRKLHYARGKTLGGTSARNFMFYHRPSIGSLQKWAEEVGDDSFTFDNMLPFYKKSVHYTPPSYPYQNSSNEQDSDAYSADGGPLKVSFGNYEDPFGTWAQKAFQAVGQKAIKGFGLGKLIGSAYMALTINPVDGHRSSSASSFLESTKEDSQGSLRVYNNTQAQKILFSRWKNIATGVVVSSATKSSSTYTLHAKKEIILSAGAFHSPQLLMVSGIGPADLLKQHNIPVLKDLPGVGQNLWDQPFFASSYRVDVSTAAAIVNNPTLNALAIAAYVNNATGPYSLPSVPVIGWETLPEAARLNLSASTQRALAETFPSDWPDIEFVPGGAVIGDAGNLVTGGPRDGYNYASISTSLMTPLSRGNVSISSASVADPPLINPNWLTHPADVEVAIAAFKRSRDVWAELKGITIGEEYLPGKQVQTDEEILAYIRRTVATIWHPAATCKMGKKWDSMAVVDTRFRVFGTKGLRVVDASSFPFLPPGHPQATVYALAEKAAEDILLGRWW